MEIILAIDGGGSSTRCLALNRDGKVVGEATSGPSNHLLVAKEVVVNSLQEAIDGTLSVAGLNCGDVVCVSAGLAGVDYDGTGKDAMEEVLRGLGFWRLNINGDMVIAHAGALGAQPGVVALAGTGSCILGIGPGGERVKVGGWGPIYGDEGSAYRIASMALRAAARATDGRGSQTALVGGLEKALNVKDFQESVARVYGEQMRGSEIAALSRVVNELAEDGDAGAVEILQVAGGELAEGVLAALARLQLLQKPALVSYQGSVLASCGILLERFKEVITEHAHGASVVVPRFEPVMGAAILGFETVGWEGAPSMGLPLKRLFG